MSEDIPIHTETAVAITSVGITESDARLLALHVLESHPGIDLTVLEDAGIVRLVLRPRPEAPSQSATSATDAIAVALQDRLVSTDGTSLPETVLRLARDRGASLATAESCTGGLVAAALTDIPGSSESFLGGIVAYSDSAKSSLLDVSDDTLLQYGAVSAQTALEMARGVCNRLGVSHGVSTTGIAGPSGESTHKPVGLVWFGLVTPEDSVTFSHTFPPHRDSVRSWATNTALDALRRSLAGLEVM